MKAAVPNTRREPLDFEALRIDPPGGGAIVPGDGPASVVEQVGSNTTARQAYDLAGEGGTAVMVGEITSAPRPLDEIDTCSDEMRDGSAAPSVIVFE